MTDPKALRLAFLGAPDFAVPTLAALIASSHDIAAVYTQPPRPAGRGHRAQVTPVHALAEAHGLVVRTPTSLKDPVEHEAFRALDLDAAIVAAYGLILPRAILDATRLGCLNLHPSLLPRWRGAAPIQRAIMAGDAETGIAIMLMDEGLDSGPVLALQRFAIPMEANAGAIHDEAASKGAALMLSVVEDFAAGRIAPRPQDAGGVTYAAKITPEDTRIDWRRSAAEIERQIRALAPAPGAWFELQGSRVKVFASETNAGPGSAAPGEALDGALAIRCGEGALRLTILQRPGKKAMAASEFLKGLPVPAGTRLA